MLDDLHGRRALGRSNGTFDTAQRPKHAHLVDRGLQTRALVAMIF